MCSMFVKRENYLCSTKMIRNWSRKININWSLFEKLNFRVLFSEDCYSPTIRVYLDFRKLFFPGLVFQLPNSLPYVINAFITHTFWSESVYIRECSSEDGTLHESKTNATRAAGDRLKRLRIAVAAVTPFGRVKKQIIRCDLAFGYLYKYRYVSTYAQDKRPQTQCFFFFSVLLLLICFSLTEGISKPARVPAM